jgi:hypothetical protein
MKAGGYFDKVMASGPELDRVKRFLRILADECEGVEAATLQLPWMFPPFPGLRARPWWDPAEVPAAGALGAAHEAIRSELLGADGLFVAYSIPIVDGEWSSLPLYHAGIALPRAELRFPRTFEVVRSLEGVAKDLPTTTVTFSRLGPGTHLAKHASWDALRVRLHLPLVVPDGCSIRVGSEVRDWREAQVLAFDESFEHEVWHRGATERIVLIVDCWHPDLTGAERAALAAGLRKSEICHLITDHRTLPAARPFLDAAFAKQDALPEISAFWGR